MTKRLDTGGEKGSPKPTPPPPSLLIHKSKVFFAELAGQIPPNKGHDLQKRTLQSKLREKFGYIVQNYLVES